ncbi:tetratricopeptide repeat protein [Streptomyces sp. NPDC014891]|uniref:tetratricopeptide repeat protein n=1 Tax=Streptomyces sp. NPDC014891 TaxID=3364929 RepID=UPI003700CA57
MTGRNDGRAEGQGRVYQASGDMHISEHHHHGPSWSGPDSVRLPAVGRPPVVLRDRADIMARLRAAVVVGAGNEVLVLHGLGGCGKTAVAYALFQESNADGQRLGLWVNASDQGTLRAGMLAVAADRGAGQGELVAARSGLRAAADLVWEYLDRSDRPWLLVLDNADEPAVLRDGGWLRTSPRGTVLVTTRQASVHWWQTAELVHVGVLPRVEAAQVLCDLAPERGSAEEAAEIADRLGRLPLALTLAGGFLAHQFIQPWSMSEYGRHLRGDQGIDPITLIDQGAAGNDSRHLVSGTWQLSMDHLVAGGVPEAVALLRLLACWSSDPLPLSLLAGASLGPSLPAFRVEPALKGLLDHSLTELVDGRVRSLRTHGVLLDSVARGTPGDEREPLAAAAAGLLAAALPEVPERGAADAGRSRMGPHVLALLRRIRDWPEVLPQTAEAALECALRLVTAQHRVGDYASSHALGTTAGALGEKRLGGDHPLVLSLRQRVGRSLYRLGHFEEAEEFCREALDDCERALGPAAPVTLDTCVALFRPLRQLGRTADAVALMSRVVEGRSSALGPFHPLTLLARSHPLEVDPGPELDAAAPTAMALLAECRRELGPRHQITMAVELNCPYALHFTGRSIDALPLARKALRHHEEVYGEEYPITLAARHLLVNVLSAVGEQAEAVVHAEKVVAGRQRVLGAEHLWTRAARELLDQCRAGGRPAGDGHGDEGQG